MSKENLTEEQEERLLRITRYKAVIAEVSKWLVDERSECHRHGHVIRKSEKSDAAICIVCGRKFGWWCENSPDHVCHYYTMELEDRNGRKLGARFVPLYVNVRYHGNRDFEFPKRFDGEDYKWRWQDENDDHCLYCLDAEERK